MKLYAARHGETTWNVEGRILGSTPGELTDKGKAQAEELAKHIQQLNPSLLIASDLARVQQTIAPARTLCPQLSIELTERLRERNFGDLEGKLFKEVDWDGFWALPTEETQYGAESLGDFTRRIARFIVSLESRADTDNILVVSHIGVMNRLNYLQNPDTFAFVKYPNADVVEFDLDAMVANSQALLTGKITTPVA